MKQSNGGWKRAIAWGPYFQECEFHKDCYDALNATRQSEVLDYACKKVAMYNNSNVCLCSMRQLKQGVNCNEFTTASYLGMPLKILFILCILLVTLKGFRMLVSLKNKKNAVFIALLLATAQTISSFMWLTGMLIRNATTDASTYQFADVMVKYVAVPMGSVTLMTEHGVIAIAWQRSMTAFKKKSKSRERTMKWFERAVKVYLVVVPLCVLYFNISGLFTLTSYITLGSLAGFTAGFVFVGVQLHGMLVNSTASGIGAGTAPASGKLTSGKSKSGTSTAIRAIQVYTKKIAVGNVFAIVCMLLFSIGDRMGVYSTEENVFHLDAVMEAFVAFSIGNCSRNIMNYIQMSKRKRGNRTGVAVGEVSGSVQISSNVITDADD